MTGGRAGVTLEAVTEASEGFRRTYEQHFEEVHRFLARLLGDSHAAEDATQETFVRLHRAFATLDETRPLRPFVLAIARNVAIDALRARKKNVALVDGADRSTGPAEAATASERRAVVEEALGALDPEHRSLLVLRHVHELELATIAEGASCTVRTVRNRLRAAGEQLGRELKRRGIVSSGEVRE